jgi:hypothetical protein
MLIRAIDKRIFIHLQTIKILLQVVLELVEMGICFGGSISSFQFQFLWGPSGSRAFQISRAGAAFRGLSFVRVGADRERLPRGPPGLIFKRRSK